MAITNYQLLNKATAPSPFNNVRYVFDKFRVRIPVLRLFNICVTVLYNTPHFFLSHTEFVTLNHLRVCEVETTKENPLP